MIYRENDSPVYFYVVDRGMVATRGRIRNRGMTFGEDVFYKTPTEKRECVQIHFATITAATYIRHYTRKLGWAHRLLVFGGSPTRI